MSGFWFHGARFSVVIGMLVATALDARDAHAAIGPVIGAEPITPFSATVPGGTVTVPIPSGFLVHEIEGNDRRIDRERAWYAPAPNLIGVAQGQGV